MWCHSILNKYINKYKIHCSHVGWVLMSRTSRRIFMRCVLLNFLSRSLSLQFFMLTNFTNIFFVRSIAIYRPHWQLQDHDWRHGHTCAWRYGRCAQPVDFDNVYSRTGQLLSDEACMNDNIEVMTMFNKALPSINIRDPLPQSNATLLFHYNTACSFFVRKSSPYPFLRRWRCVTWTNVYIRTEVFRRSQRRHRRVSWWCRCCSPRQRADCPCLRRYLDRGLSHPGNHVMIHIDWCMFLFIYLFIYSDIFHLLRLTYAIIYL